MNGLPKNLSSENFNKWTNEFYSHFWENLAGFMFKQAYEARMEKSFSII